MTELSNLTNHVNICTIWYDPTWHYLTRPPELPVHKPFEKWRSLDYPCINGTGLSWHYIILTVVPWPIQEEAFQVMIPTFRVPPVKNQCSISCIYSSYRYHCWSANNFDSGWPARVDSVFIKGNVRPNQEDCWQAFFFWNWTITKTATFDIYNVLPSGTLAWGWALRLKIQEWH